MPQAILKFNLNDPDDRDSFKQATKANNMALALWEMRQQIFRPARKHGYPDSRLADFFNPETVSEAEINARIDLVGELERLFGEILTDNEVHEDL